eukprot:TRINITY_DN58415_c0_g1_i1.p1 TRINITY_DN58415_c0_g1~~TRINITY_DN58415_c0_g1_i1.p1  ORF type:complete len:297 (-),score=25.30 TRINITY_DN58415_c0_g1_i1:76-966(-)
MPAGAPDPYVFQECIKKEEKFLDSCLARNAAGEDFRKTFRDHPIEFRGLARTNTAPHSFQSTLTAKDRTLLAEFETRRSLRTAPCAKQRWLWEHRAGSLEEGDDPMNAPKKEKPYNRAKGKGELPYAAVREKTETTTYRMTFNGECPWARNSSTFRAPSRPMTGIYQTRDSQEERPKTSVPPTPMDSATRDHQTAVLQRMKNSPWATVVPHEPALSSAKFNYTLSDTKFPLSVTRTVHAADVWDVQDRMLSVPFVDITSADGRSSKVVRPHGVGALVTGPLKATSSFRHLSQTTHF